MRSSAARRLLQAASLVSLHGNRAPAAFCTASVAHLKQATGTQALGKDLRTVWLPKRSFAVQSEPHDPPLDPEHVNVSNEIDKELLRATSNGVPALLKVIESHGEDFSEVNVATAFHELAKAAEGKDLQDMHVHDTFQTLVDMAIMGRRRFNARLLTSIVKSAAELKFDDEALLDKLSQNLLSRVEKLDAIEVTDLASGLADLEHSPSVILFDALQKRAKDIDADFSEEQKKELKTAFEKLGYADKL